MLRAEPHAAFRYSQTKEVWAEPTQTHSCCRWFCNQTNRLFWFF